MTVQVTRLGITVSFHVLCFGAQHFVGIHFVENTRSSLILFALF